MTFTLGRPDPVEPAPGEKDGEVAASGRTPAMAAAMERREEGRTSDSGWDILRSLGAIIGPTTALTAILYYFGWARARAQFIYFAVDQKELGLSTTDYLLRSLAGAFWPVIFLLAAIIVGLWVYSTLNQTLLNPELPSWKGPALYACVVVAGVLWAIRGYTGVARTGAAPSGRCSASVR